MVDISQLQRKLLDEIIDGAVMYMGDKIADYVRQQFYTNIEKSLKQYSKGTIKVAISIADILFPDIRKLPYIGDSLGLIGRNGIQDIIKQFVDKPPYCLAEDSNTIHCINFESTDVKVAVDGSELTSGTDYTVSGTADDFTISLVNPLASGEHDVRVADSKVAWYGKVKV